MTWELSWVTIPQTKDNTENKGNHALIVMKAKSITWF